MRFSLSFVLVLGLLGLSGTSLTGCGGGHAVAPVSGSPKAVPKTVIRSSSRPINGYYRVQRGDTLYSISWRINKDYKYLAALNGIRPPYTIYAGQRLKVSGKVVRYQAKKTISTPRPTPEKNKITVKNQSKTAISSKNSKKTLKLVWQWPITGMVTRQKATNLPSKKGLEIAGRLGQIVRSAADGKVVYSGNGLIGYGNLVIVKHSEVYLSAYGYNRRLLVKEGDQVMRGQGIAEMGLGKNRKPVLYFEIRRNGQPVDPRKYLPR